MSGKGILEMDYKHKQTFETLANPRSFANDKPRIVRSEAEHRCAHFNSHGVRNEQAFSAFTPPLDPTSKQFYQTGHNQSAHDIKRENHPSAAPFTRTIVDFDPRAMLSNLSFLEQKIHQVQDVVCSIVNRENRPPTKPNEWAAQEQLVRADLTSIIVQLISTAGTLLPSIKGTLLSDHSSVAQLRGINGSPSGLVDLDGNPRQSENFLLQGAKSSECEEPDKGTTNYVAEVTKPTTSYVAEVTKPTPDEENDEKGAEDGTVCENLPHGSYEILQLEKEEILAPHTHFCLICGKGFKRDANLRMHMRGHGDEYKSPSALAKPSEAPSSEPVVVKRYSCPFVGCKRNKEHKKFQPLKTILCVKNHYKRSHCDKRYTCSKCRSKKFSVIADLKTHEKHCGRDKWLCSCGMTFSRKDKLFGHAALFQGHTPALPTEETKGLGASDQGQSSEAMTGIFNFGGSSTDDIDVLDVKVLDDDDASFFAPVDFDSCNFGGLNTLPQQAFGLSESSSPFLTSVPRGYARKNSENLNSG